MLRVMIDSMVFDALADDPQVWDPVVGAVREGRLVLVTTVVQEDQIAAVPDAHRRRQLQRVPREVVAPSTSAVGDGVPVHEAVRDGPRHLADAVIADTARDCCDVLVTEDRRLAEAAASDGLEVWSVARLMQWSR